MSSNAHQKLYRPYRPGAVEINDHDLTRIPRKALPQSAPSSNPPEYQSTSRISTVGQPDFNQWSHGNEYLSRPVQSSTQEVRDGVATDNDIGPKLLQPPAMPAAIWSAEANRNGNPWQPGFWVRFPVSGVAALGGAVLCMIQRMTISSSCAHG
jgi:hypothetical protein